MEERQTGKRDRAHYKRVMRMMMEKRKLTTKRLAKVLYMSIPTVNKVLGGSPNTSLASIKAVNDALGLDLTDLIIFRHQCGIEASKNEKLLLLDLIEKGEVTVNIEQN